jgi:hypothetical protein
LAHQSYRYPPFQLFPVNDYLKNDQTPYFWQKSQKLNLSLDTLESNIQYSNKITRATNLNNFFIAI